VVPLGARARAVRPRMCPRNFAKEITISAWLTPLSCAVLKIIMPLHPTSTSCLTCLRSRWKYCAGVVGNASCMLMSSASMASSLLSQTYVVIITNSIASLLSLWHIWKFSFESYFRKKTFRCGIKGVCHKRKFSCESYLRKWLLQENFWCVTGFIYQYW